MLRVNHLTGFGSGGLDPNAALFLNAAGITDNTQRRAINQLVKTMKTISVWSKMQAIYPYIGGTSTTHKFNLKDPQDTDGAFRGVFAGTVTHDANGVTGNGTTGYMDTKYNQSTHGAVDDEHISVYCRSAAETTCAIGVNNAADGHSMIFPLTGGNFTTRSQATTSSSSANADSSGYFSVNRTANAGYRKRKNATNADITQAGGASLGSFTFFVMARNNSGTPGSFAVGNYAWAAIGRGLTETEDGNLRTAVEAFQDTLGRGVI